MLVNGASKSFVYNQKRTEGSVRSDQSLHVGHSILERAAEALYEFVFSGCDRLDGQHRWADCNEETKEGFRREAGAVLDAIWPLYREIKSSKIDRRAN